MEVSPFDQFFQDMDSPEMLKATNRLLEEEIECYKKKLARYETALNNIKNKEPWVGEYSEYGQGHDAAREAAAEITSEALGRVSFEVKSKRIT